MKNFDYKGKQLFSGDEYFIFENENGFEAVHCEEVHQYLLDKGYLILLKDNNDYEKLKEVIYKNFGIHPETYLKNGEFK